MLRLTREQVREVDRLAIEELRIPGIVLMENAARGAAAVACAMLRRSGGRAVHVLCGGGNNGGDGLAVARHLHNAGFDVSIGLCTEVGRYKGDALTNWRIVEAMKLTARQVDERALGISKADLIVDAIFGTGLSEPPRPPFEQIVESLERSRRPVLAIDLPSGLDCDTGRPLGQCVRATRTVTFVAQKAGFALIAARRFTGRVSVVDIGTPPSLVERVRGIGALA